MAEATGIAWSRSTFNAWIGCTEVGPGCDDCYAKALDARHRWGGATHWGPGVPRMRTAPATWNQPLRWNALAKAEQDTHRLTPRSDWKGVIGFWPVFCASLADVFDNEVDQQWREDLWELIGATPYLTWQIVTKRIGNVMKMIPAHWRGGLPRNIWIIATTVDQAEFDRDWPKLREIPAKVRGLSVEPMLGPLVLPDEVRGLLHWAIFGGESRNLKRARECRLEWILEGVARCRDLDVHPFVKQGGNTLTVATTVAGGQVVHFQANWGSGKRANPTEWPAAMRVQEFPR